MEKVSMKSQRKVEKSQGKVRRFRVSNLAGTMHRVF